MNNHEHLIFLNYIEQLLHGMEQVRLDRTNLPESSLPLADALEHLGANVQNAINTDSQTGVGNRRYFNLLTKSLWADKTPFCIAFIDIDGLKSCNDSHGHSEGDLYISSVCSTLESICLDDEFLFRLGGDEFLILSLSSDSNALKKRLESQRQLYHNSMKTLVTYNCDFSFGCLDIVPDDTHNFSELLSLADQKMYEQKVQHYIHRKHTSTDSTLPSSDDAIDIDKSGLDNRVFDAFALTSSNRYIYLCNLSTDVSRWSTQAVLLIFLRSICCMRMLSGNSIFIRMTGRLTARILMLSFLVRKRYTMLLTAPDRRMVLMCVVLVKGIFYAETALISQIYSPVLL